MKKLLMTGMLLIAGVAIMSAKETKILVVTTNPEMHCNNCEKRIKDFFKFEKGIKKIETSLKAQEVKLTYDADKTSKEKLVQGFGKIDYEVKVLADSVLNTTRKR